MHLPRSPGRAYLQNVILLVRLAESVRCPPPGVVQRHVRDWRRDSGDWRHREGGSASRSSRAAILPGGEDLHARDEGFGAAPMPLTPGPPAVPDLPAILVRTAPSSRPMKAVREGSRTRHDHRKDRSEVRRTHGYPATVGRHRTPPHDVTPPDHHSPRRWSPARRTARRRVARQRVRLLHRTGGAEAAQPRDPPTGCGHHRQHRRPRLGQRPGSRPRDRRTGDQRGFTADVGRNSPPSTARTGCSMSAARSSSSAATPVEQQQHLPRRLGLSGHDRKGDRVWRRPRPNDLSLLTVHQSSAATIPQPSAVG